MTILQVLVDSSSRGLQAMSLTLLEPPEKRENGGKHCQRLSKNMFAVEDLCIINDWECLAL